MKARTRRDADNRTRIVLECSLAEFDTLATLVMETDYTRPVLGAAVAEQLNAEFAMVENDLFESDSSE
jgi:hypothetical protein